MLATRKARVLVRGQPRRTGKYLAFGGKQANNNDYDTSQDMTQLLFLKGASCSSAQAVALASGQKIKF